MPTPAVAEQSAGSDTTGAQRVSIKVFDQDFTLRSDKPATVVQSLARLVDSNMRGLARRYPDLPPLKLAILVSLHLAEELQESKDDYDSLVSLIEEGKK